MTGFNISAVERETGISRDVLRMWERRYGFPVPGRDANGERVYPIDQVERLRSIKRLLDQGHRPGKIVLAAPEELANLVPRRPAPPAAAPGGASLQPLLDLLKAHDVPGYQKEMQYRLVREGLQRFVLDTVAPLTVAVGDAWEDGRFEVFEEHFFAEQTSRFLRQAIATLPENRNSRPRIVLTTPPEEQHMLGLLMAEAIFELEHAHCIPLGVQMPLVEIQRAALGHQADIVGLSISSAYPSRQILPMLEQLRTLLPESVELWVGGAGIERLAAPAGVRLLPLLEDAMAALGEWRLPPG